MIQSQASNPIEKEAPVLATTKIISNSHLKQRT